MRDGLELSFAVCAAGRSDPRAAIEAAAAAGYRAIQLDATAPGVRARELDRSGRRDLAALLRRRGLRLSGLDLLIPPADFGHAERADRALAAALGALDLASDLCRLAGVPGAGASVCLELPGGLVPEIAAALRTGAEAAGVRVADLAWPARQTAPGDPLAVGLDPARVLLAGADLMAAVAALGTALACARLSDTDGVSRIVPLSGRGRLDALAYRASLGASGYRGAIVADLRGVGGVGTGLPEVWSAMGTSAGPV